MKFEDLLIKKLATPQELFDKKQNFILESQLLKKHTNNIKVLLLGHNYNIYDDYISMGLIRKLRKNKIDLITTEMVEKIYNDR